MIPDYLHYTKSHEWILIQEDIATVGITHHAQEELSDVVYVELPDVGRAVDAGEASAVVESVKAASDIYSPLSGDIVETNETLEADPSKINNSPYEEGWLFKLRMKDLSEIDTLLKAEAYHELIG